MYAGLLASFSQNAETDSSTYKARKLTFEEVNLISSYYVQDGDHASVTGGTGSEKLTDFANILDVKFSRYDRKNRKHTYSLEAGIDNYTSASSDQIDLIANSSASASDMRIYPSLSWSLENEKKGTTFGAGASFSTEYDYNSFGGDISFAQKTKNRNGEFFIKLQAYLDQVLLIYPVELRIGSTDFYNDSYGTDSRNSFSVSASYSQIINQRFQLMFLADVVKQSGFLGLPFHRVYFTDNSVHVENLPDSRLKIPLGLRANYFLGDKIILRAFYRYYQDDWDLKSNTVNFEIPIKISPFFSFTPFYRFYNQTAIKYFAPYGQHDEADQYYTSNFDLSSFSSNFLGAGIRLTPLNGVFGYKHFNMMEIRYGFYNRSNGLASNIVSLNLKFN